jgi:TRAP-type uncharacterized transport system substrate-binding protein
LKHSITTALTILAAFGTVTIGGVQTASAQATELQWATSAVGSAGHRALVSVATVLNRELPEYSITVLPTPGAAATIRGYAIGEFDGYYGADIAFHEVAGDTGRFAGFRDQVENELLQSFWAYTLEVGIGVRAADAANYSGWGDLAGETVFTGPSPWDVRAALERPMQLLEVGHNYVELDTGLAGQSLMEGNIDGFIVYTTGGASPAPWVSEAMLSSSVTVLNPSEEEIARLAEQGVQVVDVSPDAFETDIGVETAKFVPFFYGFHVGMNVPEEDVYRMLVAIEENVDDLVAGDPGLAQLAESVVDVQRNGIIATGDAARIHPGLARFLRERDAWYSAWDDNVAS